MIAVSIKYNDKRKGDHWAEVITRNTTWCYYLEQHLEQIMSKDTYSLIWRDDNKTGSKQYMSLPVIMFKSEEDLNFFKLTAPEGYILKVLEEIEI